ncbi:DNA internalization-related competence protein ComEC/Rec2 [Pseudomaricurvus sp.]|uniref:DNA internalization-related competence protein ComEC/Rec2 n=1 Tax=Pseudomaricurvus sp. TaxID=2004510 RepID=UPI003F6D27B9
MNSVIFRCFFVGAFALAASLPEIPSVSFCILITLCTAVVVVAGIVFSPVRLKVAVIHVSVVLLAFLWAVGWGSLQLENRLAPELEGRDLWVQGRVEGLVSRQSSESRVVQRLTFRVEEVRGENQQLIHEFPSHLRLSLYGGPKVLGGEGWRFQVRLKRPHGFANPGGFDYERWLLSRGIGATGYVLLGDEKRVEGLDSPLQRWRSGLRQDLIDHLGDNRSVAVLLALAMGDRSLLADSDAKMIQQMGLSHLLSISGLHIGLAAALGFLIGRLLGACLSLGFPLRVFGPHYAWLGAVVVASVYGWMAGFSLATQRALMMLIVAAFWYCCYRRYSVWLGWWVSMMAVLVLQPLSILEPGFWFSFVAVAVLLLLLSRPVTGWHDKLMLLLKVQLALFLIMGGLQLFWGMGVSGVSPLVNYLAVPYVSIAIVPLILLALFVSVFSQQLAAYVWQLITKLIDIFWWGLDKVHPIASEWLLLPELQLSPVALVVGCVGLLLAILPLGLYTRLLGLMSMLVLVLPAATIHQQPRLSVLDVGQGLAVVVGSQNRWLLYDTGPEYSENFDAGKAVVVPFLFDRGVRAMDLGIVSHWDKDHSGGLQSVQESIDVARWMSGRQAPESMAFADADFAESFDFCTQDSQFQLGDWRVSILGNDQADHVESNNASCVVLLETKGFRALLSGDIERSRELSLLSHPWLQEPVDVLVAPHHGSGTSSSLAFVSKLAPRWVVFSAGYRNRYGHPQEQVVDRYRQLGAQLLYTSRSGAIEFAIGEEQASGSSIDLVLYRQGAARYWR